MKKGITFYSEKCGDDPSYPYVIFKKENWNDYYTYYTAFLFQFIPEPSYIKFSGYVKILNLDNDDTVLPEKFDELPPNYCTLANSTEFYIGLKSAVGEDLFRSIVVNLNDLAFCTAIVDKFKRHHGFNSSLIRDVDAARAFKNAAKVINNVDCREPFNFTFSCLLPNADAPHSVSFKFSNLENQPFRIFTIIGQNGTGKTQFLSKLALYLSGQEREKDGEPIAFSPGRPLFSKVLAVSYSYFDSFKIPIEDKLFSYDFCGIRDNDGLITEEKKSQMFLDALTNILNKNRKSIWLNALKILFDNSTYSVFDAEFSKPDNAPKRYNHLFRLLSSGQNAILLIVTNIISKIKEESMILFDEPELHLHPAAIGNLMLAIYKILDHFESFMIVATHSPIILQDVPSRNVRIFDRIDNFPIIKELPLECFGETISTITSTVFETIKVKEYYKWHFNEMSSFFTYDQIVEKFDHNLSLNAKLYLKTRYSDD